MRGKAQRDSPVLVLLAPPGEYDWMIRQLVPQEDSQIPVETTVATTVQSKFNNNIRSLHLKNIVEGPAQTKTCLLYTSDAADE